MLEMKLSVSPGSEGHHSRTDILKRRDLIIKPKEYLEDKRGKGVSIKRQRRIARRLGSRTASQPMKKHLR